MSEPNSTLGHGRFALLQKLGVGGMGSVYEALDSKRNVRVALKSLGQIDPLTVSSFKAEFRDFQHLHHPNLVVLDELFSEDDEWHFTMELLDGEQFLGHVRHGAPPGSDEDAADPATEMASAADHERKPSSSSRVRVYPGRLDLPALCETLRQLTAGLSHLHSAGKVHRDVKSSNVIITRDGRVVLLDFGVSVDVKGKGVQLAGTPLYMAPELFWQSATPAADWYSVGVLLYQALTGMDPWQGGMLSNLLTSKRPPPAHPSDLDPSIPDELGDLCLALLAATPRDRAGRRAILEWLESAMGDGGDETETWDDESDAEIFIGRSVEGKILREALDDLPVRDEPLVVFVEGESGIGKSALVQNFTSTLTAGDRATVLRGRVLEEEVVPYKSVDGIIDSLCEYFLEIGYEKVQPLLPEHFNIVADVFPVLRRSAKVAELPRTSIPDPTERRLLMFAALKECLRRLAERTHLILTVDDLQWSDADSLTLWNELVRGPDAPRMLLIATLRTDRTGSLRPSRRPPSMIPGLSSTLPKLPVPTRSVWLPRLSETESMAYLEARGVALSTSVVPEDIIHEASGHPLFIDELLRYRGKGIGAGELTLEYVLMERIAQLDADHRRYLQLTCISAKPLPRVIYAKAAALTHGEGLRAFKALRAGRLVRTGRAPGSDGDDWVDAFHYRIRNACLHDCTEAERAALHRAIAVTLEAEGRLDPEQLAIEWRDAGEPAKGALYAEAAADSAFTALAFQKAAEFYADALQATEPTSAKAQRLQERLARSLRNAGNGKAAADAFLDLAKRSGLEAGFAYKCEAVELLLRSGYVDEALTWAHALLGEVGESMPTNNASALAELAWYRARIFAGRHRWRPAASYPAEVLRRVDALWSVCFGLGSVAQLPSFALCAKYVQRALGLGEPMRVARAFAVEGMVAANGKNGNVEGLLAEARRAEASVPDQRIPLVWSATAMAMVLSGAWPAALDAAREALTRIAKECAGSVGEWAMAAEAELWALAATGRYGELATAAQTMRARADKSRDLYSKMAASNGVPNVAWLAADQPQKAIELTGEPVARGSRNALGIHDLFNAYARAQAHLYLDEVKAGIERFAAYDREAKGQLVPVPLMMQVFRLDLEARLELTAAFQAGARDGTRLALLTKKLRRLGTGWGTALATLLAAGTSHLRGDRAAAIRDASRASSALAAAGMTAHAEAAAAYAERLRGADGVAGLRALEAHGVTKPERFITLLIPGYHRP